MASRLSLVGVLLLAFAVLFSPAASRAAQPATPTPAFDPTLFTQPPTVVPAAQADNGAQLYWGMCLDCHGERGQGLSADWRSIYPADLRDCWQSGCHGAEAPADSFQIPETGAPALAGGGTLSRFENAFELQSFLQASMPLFPSGALTARDAWSLTAFLLRQKNGEAPGLTLEAGNAAAIPVHRLVELPASGVPGGLVLAAVLLLAAAGLGKLARHPAERPARPSFIAHLHPARLPAAQARLRHTLAAGGLAVFFSLVLLVTGLLEMYYYVPAPAEAAVSVQTLTTLVPYGGLVRNLHYWSAQLLVIAMTAHLLRVVLTGAYARPRRLNYLIGLGLLVVVLLLDFTGYVLRWDEGIRWALVVGANLLKTIPGLGAGLYEFVVGGQAPGPATLTRFYTWHVFGLTLITIILVVWHIFRLRRDGGIAGRRAGQVQISRFELLRREVLAMLVAGGVLLVLAVLVPAPIDQPISGTQGLPGEVRPPWFFLWIQQLLKLGSPFVWGVLTPLLVVLGLGLVPWLLPNAGEKELGGWLPRGNRLAQVLVTACILAILVLTVVGALSRGQLP